MNTKTCETIGSNALSERAAGGWVCALETKRRCTQSVVGCTHDPSDDRRERLDLVKQDACSHSLRSFKEALTELIH
jgi:hypothetical protein